MSIAASGKHFFSRVNVTASACRDRVSFKHVPEEQQDILEITFIPNPCCV